MLYLRAHMYDQSPTNQSTKDAGNIRYSLNRTRISVRLRSHNHLAPKAQGRSGPHLSGRPRWGFLVANMTFFAPLVMAASSAMSMEEGPPPTMRISASGKSSDERISQLCLMGNVAVSIPSNFGMLGWFSRPIISFVLDRENTCTY